MPFQPNSLSLFLFKETGLLLPEFKMVNFKPSVTPDSGTCSPTPGDGLTFYPVQNPKVLLPILLERLPYSSMMHNQVIMYPKHQSDIQFYILADGPTPTSSSWLVSNYLREDYGCHFAISAPNSMALGETPIPTEYSAAFASEPSPIDWHTMGGHPLTFFVQMPRPLATMMLEVSTSLQGKVAEVHPCRLFTMERNDALLFKPERDGVELRRLQPNSEEINFFLDTWKYALPGTDTVMRKCLERNASAGVIVDGKCVCGVYMPAMGLLSALYTLKQHRQRGYAKLVQQFALRELAREGCVPCLTVETQNDRSVQFHKALGMTLAEEPVNFLIVKQLEID